MSDDMWRGMDEEEESERAVRRSLSPRGPIRTMVHAVDTRKARQYLGIRTAESLLVIYRASQLFDYSDSEREAEELRRRTVMRELTDDELKVIHHYWELRDSP